MESKETILETLRAQCEADPENFDKAIELAQHYSDLGWFNESLDIYEKLSEKHPDNYTLFLEYGNTCYKKRDYKKSVIFFTKLTEIKPERIEGWNNLGIVQLQLGELEIARQSMEKVLEIEPENSGALLNMGNYYAGKEEFDTSVTYFQKAISVRLDFADAWFNLGNVLIQKNDWEGAINAYEKALKYQREFPSALKNLGFVYEKCGNVDKAESLYMQASELNKADPGVRVNLGNLYLMQKKYDDAKKCYLKAVRLAPNELAGWMGLRHLSLVKGDLNTFIRATLAILPRLSDEVLAKSIEILYELNQISKAEDILNQADRLGRTGNELDLQRLLIYHRKKIHPGKITAIYKNLSAMDTKSESIKKGLARFSLETHDEVSAIKYVQEMTEPDSAAQSILWRALIARNEIDEAVHQIQMHIKDNPDAFECWFLLARIEAMRGNNSRAEKYLIRSLENGFTSLDELNDCSELKKIFENLTKKEQIISE
jgi:tetratricopeptide (TPR) repeat protein